jgi:hypothetical protein
MEVLADISIIQPNQGIDILFLDSYMSKLANLHQELLLLLLSESFINQLGLAYLDSLLQPVQ